MDILVDDQFVLTAYTESDLDVLVSHMNDPVIFRNTLTIPFPYSEADGKKFIRHVIDFESMNNLRKDWALRDTDGKLSGGIGLLYEQGVDAHRSEIGYWLCHELRNKGIMSRVVGAFTRHIFDTREILRLDAHVFTDNPASARALEKAGYRREGELGMAYFKNGDYKDAWLYAMLARDLN